MARPKGLTDWNTALVRYVMKLKELTIAQLAQEMDCSFSHLSKVLSRQNALSEAVGKQLAEQLDLSWEVVSKPESLHLTELMTLSLVEFLHNPDSLDWKSAVSLADKMGILTRSSIDTGEASAAQTEDEELLSVDDVPDVEWEDIE